MPGSNMQWICLVIINVLGFATLVIKVQQNRKKAAQEMQENTQISKQAFNAANSYNEKLQKIHHRLEVLEQDFVPGKQLLERLDAIDTHLQRLHRPGRE